MKDNEIAQVINTIIDIAIEFKDTQQLRERIAVVLRPLLSATTSHSAGQVTIQQIANDIEYAAYFKAALDEVRNGETVEIPNGIETTEQFFEWLNSVEQQDSTAPNHVGFNDFINELKEAGWKDTADAQWDGASRLHKKWFADFNPTKPQRITEQDAAENTLNIIKDYLKGKD